MTPPLRVVAGIVLDGEGRLLAARRPETKHLGGLWELPGGKVEAGESDREALVRELLEELNVAVDVSERFASVQHAYALGTIELVAFTCHIVSGSLVAREHDELRWIEPNCFSELEWAPADVPVLERFASSIGQRGK